MPEHYYTDLLNPQARQFAQRLIGQAAVSPRPLYTLGSAADPSHALQDALLAARAVKYDYPHYFWLGRSWHANAKLCRGRFSVELWDEYAYPSQRCLPLVRSVKQEARSIVQNICARSGSLLQREALLFDYLFRIPYCDTRHRESHNLLGVLLERRGVCEGKAAAFCYLARLMGIPSIVIYGRGRGAGHSWNGVWLDGRFLQADCTWGPKYFNRTSADILQTHIPDPTFPLPIHEKEASHGTLYTGTNPSA